MLSSYGCMICCVVLCVVVCFYVLYIVYVFLRFCSGCLACFHICIYFYVIYIMTIWKDLVLILCCLNHFGTVRNSSEQFGTFLFYIFKLVRSVCNTLVFSLKQLGIYWGVFETFWNISERAGVVWNMLETVDVFETFWNMLVSCWNGLKHVGICWCVLCCLKRVWCLLVTVWDILEYVGTF